MIIQTQRDTDSLLERIHKAEQDLYARRHLLSVRSTALMQNTRRRMRYSLTSPVMLTAAVVAGFVAQRWVKRNFSRTPEEIEMRRKERLAKREQKLAAARKKRAAGGSDRSGLVAQGLKLIALLRTLIAALPSTWVNALPGILRTKAATPDKVSVQPQAQAGAQSLTAGAQPPAAAQSPQKTPYNGANAKVR